MNDCRNVIGMLQSASCFHNKIGMCTEFKSLNIIYKRSVHSYSVAP